MNRSRLDRQPTSRQAAINAGVWASGDHVAMYARRDLTPVEVLILVRYRDALSRRVLDVGCGGGRLLGYLVMLGGQVHGIDVSPAMVEYCARVYPQAHVAVGDVANLADQVEPPFDAIFAAGNLIDVFDDAERRRVLASLRESLAERGLLIFSSHNLAFADAAGVETWGAYRNDRGLRLLAAVLEQSPADLARHAARIPSRIRNRRRLGPLQHRAADHAIINDEALDYGLLHYYIRRDDQARQLEAAGYELLECLDVDGRSVPQGDDGAGPSLHYIARRL